MNALTIRELTYGTCFLLYQVTVKKGGCAAAFFLKVHELAFFFGVFSDIPKEKTSPALAFEVLHRFFQRLGIKKSELFLSISSTPNIQCRFLWDFLTAANHLWRLCGLVEYLSPLVEDGIMDALYAAYHERCASSYRIVKSLGLEAGL